MVHRQPMIFQSPVAAAKTKMDPRDAPGINFTDAKGSAACNQTLVCPERVTMNVVAGTGKLWRNFNDPNLVVDFQRLPQFPTFCHPIMIAARQGGDYLRWPAGFERCVSTGATDCRATGPYGYTIARLRGS